MRSAHDQVRADTLVDLILGGVGAADSVGRSTTEEASGADPAHPHPAHPHPAHHPEAGPNDVRPEINVVVSLATLLGLGGDPAQVPGLGPIPVDMARALAAEGTWRAWVTDATTGRVVATGARSYVPSEAVARLVRAREPHCRMPGCRRAAQRCDLDHAVPWPAGSTSASNLGPLCRRHHVLKTHAGWGLQSSALPDPAGLPDATDPPDPPDPARGMVPAPYVAGGGWTWRSPAGFTAIDEERPPLE